MPSASAAICEKIVLVPWPISVLAASTRTRALGRRLDGDDRRRWTSPEPVKPAPCMNVAKPMPFLDRAGPRILAREPLALRRGSPTVDSARSSSRAMSTGSRIVWPTASVSPG